MAFGLGKLAVLESKLDIYEDLSKEMLDKLERAVSTISENSNKIAIVLERHQNRLDEGDKSNQAIITTAVIATLVTGLQVAPPIFRLLTPAANASMMTPGIALVNGSN